MAGGRHGWDRGWRWCGGRASWRVGLGAEPGPAVWQHNNDLARQGAELVAGRLRTSAPQAAGMTAALRLIRLPEPLDEPGARALERRLREQHKIVVPVTCLGGWQWLRVSAQLYNTLTDYERLAACLARIWPAPGSPG